MYYVVVIVLDICLRCNFNRLALAHLNINSISNKFGNLAKQITGNVDTLDASFSVGPNSSQFLILVYTAPYRIDWNFHGFGIMFFLREDISYKQYLRKIDLLKLFTPN